MRLRNLLLFTLLVTMTTLSLTGCSLAPGLRANASEVQPQDFPTTEEDVTTTLESFTEVKIPESQLVEMSVLIASGSANAIRPGSRVVISEVTGPCAGELKNALMRRLVDNTDYQVLSRDHLREILNEAEQGWGGKFNTQTAARLGDLLGASLFLVGNVVFCGQINERRSFVELARYDPEHPLEIFAILQIIDVQTGEVVLSSSNEGSFMPAASPLLFSADIEEYSRLDNPKMNPPQQEKKRGRVRKFLRNMADRAITTSQQVRDLRQDVASMAKGEVPDDEKKKEEPINYPAFKAAEDLANGFADKFFARPRWDTVEMWKSDYWRYGDSVRFVKLGRCEVAVQLLESVAKEELTEMPDKDVAEYLHNYGVALLCNNQATEAVEKLQAAYRIGYHSSTLRMLGLASQVEEWSLNMRPDEEEEVDILIDRSQNLFYPRPVAEEVPLILEPTPEAPTEDSPSGER